MTNLFNSFDIDRTRLYTIGHSISAASLKGIAGTVSYPGSFFETMTISTLLTYVDKINEADGKDKLNVYSDGMFFASIDDGCNDNGILPKKFFNPNVFDTACLTTVVCSKTKKYVPYCKQVSIKYDCFWVKT